MIKTIIAGIVPVLIVVIFLAVFGPRLVNKDPNKVGPVTIKYWGFDDEVYTKQVIDEYQKLNPNIKIEYTRQSATNYRARVQTQIREGLGPDVFKIHNTWTKTFLEDLAEAPKDVVNLNFYQNFFPIAVDSFIVEDKIYGLPDAIDGLALYYNEEILQAVGVTPPKSWQDFIDASTKVTVKDGTGVIKTAGASIGSTSNIDHWSDILGLLLLQQPKVNLISPSSIEGAEVLTFYTGFVIDPRKKTWDTTLPNSTSLFAQGNLAFYFGPKGEAARFQQANPSLKFKITPVPQLPGRQVAWGSFWGGAVSYKSKNVKESWKFLKFLGDKEQEKQKMMQADPLLSAYVVQGPNYKSWYLAGGTEDGGLNDEMIKVWADAVNSVLAGISPLPALQNIEPKIKGVVEKYTREPTPAPKK